MALVAGAGGCTSGNGGPWVATFASALPGTGDVSRQAAAIPYASVDLTVGGHGGLLILAEQAQGLTFWQSGNRETIVFRQGYLDSTSGLSRNLLMTRISGDDLNSDEAPWQMAQVQPLQYRVERRWRDEQGREYTQTAQATMNCGDGVEKVELPLVTRALQKCRETLAWASGKTTASVLWRDVKTHRVWAADAVAWPGGPLVSWQVARPWWPQS